MNPMNPCSLESPEFVSFVDSLNAKFESYRQSMVNPEKSKSSQKIALDVYEKYVEIAPGRKFIKIIMYSPCGKSRSVYAFVNRENGDIMKPAGWKAPAKHARGNIFAEDNGLGCCGPYGVAYLR